MRHSRLSFLTLEMGMRMVLLSHVYYREERNYPRHKPPELFWFGGSDQ